MDMHQTFKIATASERLTAIGYPLRTADEMCGRVTEIDETLAPEVLAVAEKIREALDLIGDTLGGLSARMSALDPDGPVPDIIGETLRVAPSS